MASRLCKLGMPDAAVQEAKKRVRSAAYSLYDCPAVMENAIREVFSRHKGIVEGQPWYQGDHGLFFMSQRPALAITTERAVELFAEVIHTPKDSPEIVEATKLVEVAVALRDLVLHLDSTDNVGTAGR